MCILTKILLINFDIILIQKVKVKLNFIKSTIFYLYIYFNLFFFQTRFSLKNDETKHRDIAKLDCKHNHGICTKIAKRESTKNCLIVMQPNVNG